MGPKQPPDPRTDEPRKDKGRETREAVIKDADETNERDRDKVHGDGDTINLPD